jgi:hypothetical protein
MNRTSVSGAAADPRAGAGPGAAAMGLLVAALLLAVGCGGGGDQGAGDAAGEFGAAGDEAAPAEAPAGDEGADGAAGPAADAPAPEAPPPAAAEQAPAEEAPSFTSDQNRREVLLFFQERDSEYLGPERRKIFLTASPVDQAKQIVIEVINGPTGRDLLPTVPGETRLRGLYLDRSGTAYVDLSGEVSARHPGGTAEEIATLFSLVNSLTYNLPEIKRVHILIDGEERDTLVHLDLKRDYRQDLSIVDMEREKAG